MQNHMEMEFNIIWIRHGETKSNQEHRYLGRTDEELSELGIQKLMEVKKNCKTTPGQKPGTDSKEMYLVTSPMKRCVQTAEILYGRAPDYMIPQWTEMDFGAFEGKNYLELQDHPDYQKWIQSNGTLPFPEGESREQFIARCMEGLNQMMEFLLTMETQNGNSQEGSRAAGTQFEAGKENHRKHIQVCAVVHGGTIMAILSSLTGGEYFDYQVKNGMGYRTRFTWSSGEIQGTEVEEMKL